MPGHRQTRQPSLHSLYHYFDSHDRVARSQVLALSNMSILLTKFLINAMLELGHVLPTLLT